LTQGARDRVGLNRVSNPQLMFQVIEHFISRELQWSEVFHWPVASE